MSRSPSVDSDRRVSEQEWQAVLAAARDLAEKVSGLSGRLAAVEQRLISDDQ